MEGFYQESISRFSNFSDVLIERLNNGKPLSLYVDGVVSRLKPTGKSMKSFVAFANIEIALEHTHFDILFLFLCPISGSTFKFARG